MKKAIIIIFILTIHTGFGQQISGHYSDGFDHLKFKGDSIQFSISADGGLRMTYVGCGTYEIIKDYLVINSTNFCGKHSYFIMTDNNSDSVNIYINDTYDQPLFAELKFFNSTGELIKKHYVKVGENLKIKSDENIESILVSSEDEMNIKYIKNKDYHIKILNGRIWENKIIALKIKSMDDQEIDLFYVTNDLVIKKNKLNALRFTRVGSRSRLRKFKKVANI